MKKRTSGVLMHISSLPGAFSIGSFGESARLFVDKLAESGVGVWQVLPLSMADEYGSPYKSSASFGANPLFIDLPALYEEGLITAEELEAHASAEGERIDYTALRESRLKLLRTAASRVIDRTEIVDYVERSCELSRAAYFLALKEANGGAPWQAWREFECNIDELFFWQFVQYKFYTQWYSLKEYANSRSVSIIGDLPIYVDLDSADVWAEPAQFSLDSWGYPTAVSGVPPDYFAKDGQLWGNPLYNWARMKRDGFDWWRRRLSHALSMFDGVRIDHFRAIEAYWSVPADAETAKAGRWVAGPGKAFIRMIKELAGDRLIIAEDLGDITDEVRALVEWSGFPGMRVLEFGFLGDPDSIHLPHNIPPRSVAYTGTHDNNTLLGFVDELDEWGRVRLSDYLGANPDDRESILSAAQRALWSSVAELVILPVQDIFALGAEHRMNTPGVAEGNWSFRLTAEQLAAFPIEKLRHLGELYRR